MVSKVNDVSVSECIFLTLRLSTKKNYYDDDDNDDDDNDDDISQADLVKFYFSRDRFITYEQGTQGDSFSFLQISNTFLRILAVPNNAVFWKNPVCNVISSFFYQFSDREPLR